MPVAALSCFWKPMLLCHVYGARKPSTITRGDCAGSGAVPLRNASGGHAVGRIGDEVRRGRRWRTSP